MLKGEKMKPRFIQVSPLVRIDVNGSKIEGMIKLHDDIIKLEGELKEALTNGTYKEVMEKENALHEAVQKLEDFKVDINLFS